MFTGRLIFRIGIPVTYFHGELFYYMLIIIKTRHTSETHKKLNVKFL